MLDNFLYFYDNNTLEKKDSLNCQIAKINLDKTIDFIEFGQAVKDTANFHSYRSSTFFDLKATPNRKHIYRSAFANNFTRYIFKINQNKTIEAIYSIPISSGMSLSPMLPTNSGFYLIHQRNFGKKPELFFYSIK